MRANEYLTPSPVFTRAVSVLRSELAHVVRAASNISGDRDVIVIGSQAILGTYEESELPPRVTMSREADLAFWDDEEEAKSDKVDGAIGEGSSFDEMYGYYAQGVSVSTANLPWGWRDRLVRFQSNSTEPGTAWCLDAHDLVLAKLSAGREKDYEYADALIEARKISTSTLLDRVATMAISPVHIRRIRQWVEYRHTGI